MSKSLFLFVLLTNIVLNLSIAARIKHDRVTFGEFQLDDQQQQERQERRLEDTRRHYNAGYVEYKSEIIEEKRRDDNDEEELDEYVVIESSSDVNNDDNDDRRYEETDDHYDDDDDEEGIDKNVIPHRGLVPQLWPNYTGPALPPPESVSCNEARLTCAYRAGCGLALQNYVLGCSDLVKGTSKTCNTHCRHSLIALMSTPEGQRMMKVSNNILKPFLVVS
jgi:hypothetical protein